MADCSVNVNLEIEEILPTKAALYEALQELFIQPALLTVNGLAEDAEAVRTTIETFYSTLGNFPTSAPHPLFSDLEIPELEIEKTIDGLLNEYPTYVIVKMLEIISSVIPINFEITIFGITVDLTKIFTDAEYAAELRAQIVADIDNLYPLLPDYKKVWSGDYGVESASLKAHAFIEHFMTELKKSAINILHTAFATLIDVFNEIWSALGLPALPALLNTDVEQIIKDAVGDLTDPTDIKDAIGNIEILGFKVSAILGGTFDDTLVSVERTVDRYIQAIEDFAQNWQRKLLLDWMDIVTAFFEAIGLSALVQYITFTFADFIKALGIPTNTTYEIKCIQ